MKQISLIIIFMFLVGCASMNKDVIPQSWLTKISSIDHIHQANNNICLLTEGLSRDMEQEQGLEFKNEKPSRCVKETSNPFEHDLTKGYKVYEYENRNGRRLERGYALLIDDKIVDVIVSYIAHF